MRIVHVVENLNVGGAEKVMLDLLKRQLEAGHECRVICLFEPGEMASRLTEAGVPVLACAKKDGVDVGALRRIRRELSAFRADVLHSHNAMAHYYAVFASLGVSVVRINTRHGMGDFLKSGKQSLIYRFSLPFTDAVCCVCDAARRQFINHRVLPEKSAWTIHNGIFTAEFANRDDGKLRVALGLPAESLLLGTVGRLNRAKDHGALIRAFELVAGEHQRLHLVIIGEGEQRDNIEMQIRGSAFCDRIHLTGARDDVAELLAGLSVFVLSSVTEGYSIALLEAGASGLPVVATDVGGNAEILGEGRGVLVPPEQPQAMARALEQLLKDGDRAAAMAASLQHWVRKNGTVDAMYESYLNLYRIAGAS